MAMAVKPQALRIPILADMSAELIRLAAQYRFNPSHGGDNKELRRELESRIGIFIGENLEQKSTEMISKGNITITLTVHREDLLLREGMVPLRRINQLTLVWALRLLTYGYHGFTRSRVLERLKREVVWLCEAYSYSLPPGHAVFCPFINDWEEQGFLYRLVHVNDMSDPDSWPPAKEPVQQADECRKCEDEYKDARC